MMLTTAGYGPDTVSPLDHDAIAVLEADRDIAFRLPDLIRGAARSRRLADQHKTAAREHLRAAQTARAFGDPMLHRDFLDEASEARRRAAACSFYARRCEREANDIAVASGFLR